MNDKKVEYIPYYVAEGIADRLSATIKRLWIMCILLIVLLVGSNALWLYYESQFEYYEQTVEQEVEAEGNATVIGIGDNYGKGQTDSYGQR